MKMKFLNMLLIPSIFLIGCQSKVDLQLDNTEIKVEVLDDNGEAVNEALVKVFDNVQDFEEEKNTGNSNREIVKGFTEDGSVSFGENNEIDPDKDHYFFVSHRVRDRFIDLDNFNSSNTLLAENIKNGSVTDISIQLKQAKSSAKFFAKDLPEDNLPLQVYLDGVQLGSINQLVTDEPSNTPQTEEGVQSFRLSQGVTSYQVISQTGCAWIGEVEVDATESHDVFGMNSCEAGSISFWVADEDKDLLPITFELASGDEIGGALNTTLSEAPTKCYESNTMSISRGFGVYTYQARGSNNSSWNGTVTIDENNTCTIIQLQKKVEGNE